MRVSRRVISWLLALALPWLQVTITCCCCFGATVSVNCECCRPAPSACCCQKNSSAPDRCYPSSEDDELFPRHCCCSHFDNFTAALVKKDKSLAVDVNLVVGYRKLDSPRIMHPSRGILAAVKIPRGHNERQALLSVWRK